MTRKRTLRKAMVSTTAREQLSPDMEMLATRLQAEQTGNLGIAYPDGTQRILEAPSELLYADGRPDIAQIRNFERSMNAPLQDPRVYLPNPGQAPFDRNAPLGRVAKNEAFGHQIQPDRLIDLPPGDAGAGKTVYRRTHTFARLDNPANSIVAGNPMDKAIGMATYVSSDCRPRFWHISFFGLAVQRVGNAVQLQPLTNNEILSDQLKPTITSGVASPDYIPAITQMQGRVMVFDESGQRFYDVDIMGNRSLDVYAWGVTAFILVPGNDGTDQGGYEVFRGTGGNLPQQGLAGIVEDALIGVRVVPIVINSTQNDENRTITVLTNDAGDTRVPIPPGTRKVQVISHESAAVAATYSIFFDSGDDGTFAGRSDQGIININAGQSRSDVILVPDSVQIIFSPLPAAVGTAGWSLIFTVESQ